MEGEAQPDDRLRPPWRGSARARSTTSCCVPRTRRLRESATNQIGFTEGKLYEDSWKQFAPTVGFAWDPFGDGKTSVRGNYRLAWDRTNTFVFSSFIFQSAPGLTRAITLLANSPTFGGANNALLRNGIPTLSASDTTPLAFRTPPPFSVNTLTLLTALTYPRTHQFGFNVQREIGWNSVLEVSYVGGRAASSSAATTRIRWTSTTTASSPPPPAARPAARASVATDANSS